ncbi:MAG: hypothetical protein V7700_07480 [Halioglobus sp.]
MTSIVGKEAEFMQSVAETAALMQKKGLRNAVRVSHSGVPGIEVWSSTLYKDWKEYGRLTDKMLKDKAMQKLYMSSILNRTGELLDSFEMVEVPGFEEGVDSSGNIIAATAWNVLPQEGNAGNFLKSCAQAKELHLKHGANPRLWQVMGGRYSGLMMYALGFESFTSMGKWQEKVKKDQAEFMSRQPASAEIAAQIILRPSGIL